ncbi:nidogen-like domain-containing protein [Cylindrospermopsis raciborskii]|uniref:nidogen-like domain-containing protein n=1 Tax=Cylindrospermopsis raciborskii TaxID=77022 RepID=UPI0021551294|nr:nidogen-like domain-containing protein [Cylindrospermopsis raciborskii]
MAKITNQGLNSALHQLWVFSLSGDFWQVLDTAFGTEYNRENAQILRLQWQKGDFSQLPQIEIVDSGILGDGNGAYSSSENRIYLSSKLIEKGTLGLVSKVLIEEIGHYVDAYINTVDSPGDEGAIFAALVLGEVLSPNVLAELRNENDGGWLEVNGQNLEVEYNNPTVLLNGLGGQAGFGESFLNREDDNSTRIDLVSVFGSTGLNFFGNKYTELYLNNNGGVSFKNEISTYTPATIRGTTNNPFISAFWADVDTRGSVVPATPGGNSTGSNLLWYDLDPNTRTFTATWDDVGYFDRKTNLLNAFQLSLTQVGNSGDFDITFRYEAVNWTTGDASGGQNGLGGTVARAGYTSGNGVNYFELPQSGNLNDMLGLSSSSNVRIPGTFIYNVRNGEVQTINLAVSPTIATEDGTANLIYTFTRTGSTTNTLTVNYTIGGTATNGSDYSNIGTSVTFAAGSSTATVTVDPTADTTVESDETVGLTLATGAGYNIGTTSVVTGTITNDDFPSITLAVSPSSVTEDGTANLVYTFTRTGSNTNTLKVNYTIGGTATNGSDYSSTGTSVTFGAGLSTTTVIVDPIADTTVEGDETVELTLAPGTGYNIDTTSVVTGTITNDDRTLTPITNYAPDVNISTGLVFSTNGGGNLSLDTNRLSMSNEVIGVQNGTKSNFNHLFGLYEVVDPQGGINTEKGVLKPGDSDYAFYALTTARVKDFIVQAGNSDSPSTATQLVSGVSLQGNKFYAPFVIANCGTYFPNLQQGVEDFIAAENGDVNRFANSPKYVQDLVATEVGNEFNNAPRFVQEPVAYFSFGSANPDKSPHLRSYGNGVYGFEDLPATATQYSNNDFNDAVFALS